MAFVKFSFIWTASSGAFDFASDLNLYSLANALASAKWELSSVLPPLKKLYSSLDFYAQTGVIMGSVKVGDTNDQEMYLFGERMRFACNTSDANGTKFEVVLGTMPKNGLFLHLGQVTIENVVDNLVFGFLLQPNGDMKVIEKAKLELKLTSCIEKDVMATVIAGNLYTITGTFIEKPKQFNNALGWNGALNFNNINMQINGHEGSGIMITGNVFKENGRKIPKFYTPYRVNEEIVVPLVVSFSDEISHNEDVTGGKGASLGKLTKLSKSDNTFIVPNGLIVTTSAYKEFLTPDMIDEIKTLEAVVYESSNTSKEIKAACEKLTKAMIRCSLPEKLCVCLENQLLDMFSEKINSHKFAVRSSATGEDTEEMSAAGQMETFLGIQGLKEIFTAVKKCWASQFGFVAVEYKRQNGQILNAPMAVVIQEMVPCEVAGVLFTCDPVTGNQSMINITANYGLGESVVSGTEEPDTIIMKRSAEDHLDIESVIIGAKSCRIVMKNDGGVLIENVPESISQMSCLSNEQALKIGNLGVRIEKYYKSCRDIEWGILNNNIYVLQSRPVTSGMAETDYEIKHEFDGPLRCENEYFSVCNVGEVMPGATSPLGIDMLLKLFSSVFEKRSIIKRQDNSFGHNKYFPVGLLPFYNHIMLTIIDLIFRLDGSSTSSMTQGTMIGIFGRVLDDPEMFAIARERYKDTVSAKQITISSGFRLLWELFFCGKHLDAFKKEIEAYRIITENHKSAKVLFTAITHHCTELHEPFLRHIMCTEASSVWNMFLFSVLGKAKGCFDADVYSDFARLLSTCSNVESADVPSAMQGLAHSISQNINSEEFKSMSEEEALKWLQTSSNEAGIKFRNFITRHGHRCLKEFDVRSVPWGADPTPLIKLLQNLAGNCSDVKLKFDDDFNKIISELRVSLDFKSRCLLKFLLPHCRRAVRDRETCKSILIRGIDAWKKAYHQLAKVMVSEGRIPDNDLIYFFTLEEIDELLRTRNPYLIRKAKHRRRILPELDRYTFPEIMKGIPQPVDNFGNTTVSENKGDLLMKGIPVSQGIVKGYARVAITLEEATLLKPGEILVTYSTDIGWSPYFPILAGVVTELGGLISHGAVVSREYGLPCVVGLHGATKQFCTGDYVLLDGNNGILQRLLLPELDETII